MTPAAQALIAEFDVTLAQAPDAWRRDALRRLVDLFVAGSEGYGDEQVEIFDEVMNRLIQKVDRQQLAELSNRLAPIANGPKKVLGKLARHSDYAVNSPVLEHATALTDEYIIEIANKDRVDQKLLTKIASRPRLSAAVTDVLLKRGNPEIQRKIINNTSAKISESGFARLVIGLNGDKKLAAAISARKDVPTELRVWLDKVLN